MGMYHSLQPLQIAQDQVFQIGRLIDRELSKLVLLQGDSILDYWKNIVPIHDYIITELSSRDLWTKKIRSSIDSYFSYFPEAKNFIKEMSHLHPIDSEIVINQLKHFKKDLTRNRSILEKEISHNQEDLAKEILKQYSSELYEWFANEKGIVDLNDTDGFLPLVENKNLPLSDQIIIKNVNNGARRVKIYGMIAQVLIEKLDKINPVEKNFQVMLEDIYQKYIDINAIFEKTSLENKFPTKDKEFFERQWLEYESIIDKAWEELYLGKLKKHWFDYLSDRKKLVKQQELMNLPEDKKIVSREFLFALKHDEYDLTLGEYAAKIKQDIEANKKEYEKWAEAYLKENKQAKYDENGKGIATDPELKADILKNYYILRAAEFFLQNS